MPLVDSAQALLVPVVDLSDGPNGLWRTPKNRWQSSVIGRIGRGRPGMLSLQAVRRRGREARLLDNDRGGAHERSIRGPEGRMGAAARDRREVWGPADLCVPSLDHVLAEGLLFLRAPEDKISRALHYARASA